MTRRWVIALVVLLLFVGVTAALATTPLGGRFGDDDGNIHEPSIEAIAAEGITRGCNPPLNDLFCPSAPVTRGQMAAFLVRALDLSDDGGGSSFVDDDGSVFEMDIARLAAAGITKGCNPPLNDMFCPDAVVTRGQMAAFLVRAFGYVDDGVGDLFVDDNYSIFEADIDRLAAAGITKGCNPPDNDNYCPDQAVTRGQMASFLARALDLAVPQSGAVLTVEWSVDPPELYMGQPFVIEAKVLDLGIVPITSIYVVPRSGCLSTDPVSGPVRLVDDGDALLEFGERWAYTIAFDQPDCEPVGISVVGASFGATDMDLIVHGEWDLGEEALWPIDFEGRFEPSQPRAGDTVSWIVTVESLAPYEIGSVQVSYGASTDVPLFPTRSMSGPIEIVGDGDPVFESGEIWEFVGDATVTENTSFYSFVEVWPTHLFGQGYAFWLEAEVEVSP